MGQSVDGVTGRGPLHLRELFLLRPISHFRAIPAASAHSCAFISTRPWPRC